MDFIAEGFEPLLRIVEEAGFVADKCPERGQGWGLVRLMLCCAGSSWGWRDETLEGAEGDRTGKFERGILAL